MLANLEFNCVLHLPLLSDDYAAGMQIREGFHLLRLFFFFYLPNLTSCKSWCKKMRFIRRAVSVSLGFLCLPETDSAFVHKNLSPRQRNALPLQDEAEWV